MKYLVLLVENCALLVLAGVSAVILTFMGFFLKTVYFPRFTPPLPYLAWGTSALALLTYYKIKQQNEQFRAAWYSIAASVLFFFVVYIFVVILKLILV